MDRHVQHALEVRTHTEALAGAPISALVKEHGFEPVQHAVQAGVAMAMMAYAPARRMSGEQIVMFCTEIMNEYPYESIADVRLFCRYAATSSFDDGKTFGAIDVPMMLRWWRQHLVNKVEALEVARKSEAQRLGMEWAALAKQNPKLMLSLKQGEYIGREERKKRSEDAAKELAMLMEALPTMSVEELRSAYKGTHGKERAAVLAEANRRGLMGADAKAAQEHSERMREAERATAKRVEDEIMARHGVKREGTTPSPSPAPPPSPTPPPTPPSGEM